MQLAPGKQPTQAWLAGWAALLTAAALSANGQTESPPSILAQPTNQVDKLGDTVSFTLSTSGSSPVYMWYFNGAGLPGQNAATLTLTNAKPENVGLYYAQIADRTGRIVAQSDTVTLNLPGPDLAIISQPDNQTVFLGGQASFFVSATSSAPLRYQWLHDTKPIAGATNASLAIPHVMGADIGSYRVRVSTSSAAILSEGAALMYTTEVPPTITVPPASQNVPPGQTVHFDVTAIGTGQLSYIWRHNGVRIPGAATASLVLTNVQVSDAGEYWVGVSSAAGTTVSASATLNVLWIDMAAIPDVSLKAGAFSEPISIMLSGDQLSLATASLSALSSNPDVLSPDNLLFSGSGSQWSMIIMAKPDSAGTARIAVTAASQGQSATREFLFTAIGANLPPVISNLASTATVAAGRTVFVPFTVADAQSASSDLQSTAQLVGTGPISAVQVTGTGADRVLVATAGLLTGTQSAVVSVRDGGGLVTKQSVEFTVVPPRLEISVDGAELVISTADAAQGAQLEYTDDLGSEKPWRSLGSLPIAPSGPSLMRIPTPARNVFLRLRY